MKKILRFFLIIFLVGCHLGGQGTDIEPLFIGENQVVDQTQANEAKQLVLSMEEVIEVKGANLDDNIYISARVKHFDRFFLEEIRKKAHDKVKKRFPEANVHISTDKKVLLELEKLEKKVHQNKVTKKSYKEHLKKIEEFMKG